MYEYLPVGLFMNYIANEVTSKEFFTFLFCTVLVGYFLYKEWPEARRRIIARYTQEQNQEEADRNLASRVAQTERRLDEHQEMLSRDYNRLRDLTDAVEVNRRKTTQALEEMALIIEGFSVLLASLENAGDTQMTQRIRKMEDKLNEYLRAKAHEGLD